LLRSSDRRAATALWAIGSALAGSTAILSEIHGLAAIAVVYAVVAAGLAVLAVATRRGKRWAEITTFVGLGSQLVGAAGAAWELAYGPGDTPKARHLKELGINYRWALFANLVFSLAASAVFIWAVAGYRSTRRGAEPPDR